MSWKLLYFMFRILIRVVGFPINTHILFVIIITISSFYLLACPHSKSMRHLQKQELYLWGSLNIQ